ncbi:KICSTOR complex protein C12orf66 homolog [Lingula anatina]|uniref:KICSTOR subunit 2 n=1 Tax=Lingula anatina TaxID=7574 RepID=A0A1S3HUU0_LINAN|nr:KICSTOR complex protein C12orf66 homolog [Lingula anatina]|eukprot:XP_013389810.1 KICSTOR complex protein C12orf66 homolog [Lingula anatina]
MAAALPPVPEEQAFLETFFQCLSQFAFDKAKELSEKERDSHDAAFGSSWGLLLNSLGHLAFSEKMYMSLMFLGQKWFGRKDNLRSSYSVLLSELKKIEEHAASASDYPGKVRTPERILGHLCGQLCQFLTARTKMMDFYEQLATMGSQKTTYEDLENVITEIIQAHQKSFHHPILSPLKNAFSLECDIVHNLLLAQMDMAQLKFLSSLIHLHDAHSKLASWMPALQSREQSKKLGFSRQPSMPALYQWLVRYKAALVAKFSLYFYETLSKQAPPGDLKALIAKTPVDFYARIVTFHKKSDASHVSAVFDTSGLEEPYRGPGYHHPLKIVESPTGLDSYPAVFSYPGERPAAHWPNVIMIINDRAAELGHIDKVVHFYDKQVQSTYFLAQIEPRLTFVVIFDNNKKSERDSYVCNFIQDICTQLRCTKIFSTLKPGGKS